MAYSTQTLLDYLTTPNPPINSEHSWTGSNTKSTGTMWCAYSKLKVWKDFKFDTLNELYKDLLYRVFNEEDLPNFNQKFPYHITEIRNENTLNSLLVRWNNAVVSAALAASQGHSLKDSESRGEGDIFMACGCQATIVPRQELMQNKKIPDWAGIMKNNVHVLCEGKRIMHTNLLPGDTKLSTKWKSQSIEKAKANPETNAPINQVLTYCAHAQVRYGYIITQEELVVFRVSERLKLSKPPQRKPRYNPPMKLQLGKEKYAWHMEYKAIPWELNGGPRSNDLTVNLALWWLHMLAAQERSIGAAYPNLGTKELNSEAGDSRLSSFSNKDSRQGDDTNPMASQLSSFDSKRKWDDDENSHDMTLGRVDERASKRRGGVQPDDVSMSFDSQISV